MIPLPLALAIRRLGGPNIAAGILSILLIALLSTTFILDRRIASIKRQLDEFKLPATSAPAEPSASNTPQTRYDAFKDRLRPKGDVPALLRIIFAEARQHRLQLNQMDYRPEHHTHGEYLSYHMTAPVKGAYGDIRAFVHALLLQAPALALNGISFRRDDARSPMTEARLQFVVYLRESDK
ncbi:hypothetical protein [Denitratisoma oestradiolicum]|uniref:Uncharacterized protein n=1 Tax=Denitratisoma oestradiolicum TaxID=311182 RepID=A0A6S6Y3E0_9PROT|nr:hypothetical protein [Denitratisoma oestradiolicum]TWO79992.1 hypothetical protein CBW56_11775 [Denitratisoma oestradiolicum]CAB1369756.1 conserved protein of unknown function [Denitratisoma oestradiolicum]